jgi:hypothetical protein
VLLTFLGFAGPGEADGAESGALDPGHSCRRNVGFHIHRVDLDQSRQQLLLFATE